LLEITTYQLGFDNGWLALREYMSTYSFKLSTTGVLFKGLQFVVPTLTSRLALNDF
jgi:hypothetical protein